MRSTQRAWLIDMIVGGLLGGIVAGMAAVNFVIYVGIEDGYEASIPTYFGRAHWRAS